jgi:hypothetical protein
MFVRICYTAFSDVTVYGVDVPGCDGKVGMACVVLADGLQDRYVLVQVLFGVAAFASRLGR